MPPKSKADQRQDRIEAVALELFRDRLGDSAKKSFLHILQTSFDDAVQFVDGCETFREHGWIIEPEPEPPPAPEPPETTEEDDEEDSDGDSDFDDDEQ